ncbi:hypothetical protein HD806DRAFT_537249 [Xylariaceae sp. AK1471]|nr:hypothetical protein HD806DRAFT_537249 [Xylariaceae sp. AK1471]
MFIISPYIHLERGAQHSDILPTTTANNQLNNKRRSFIDSSSESLRKPTAFPDPPRPPTPEPRPPRPYPVGPRPSVPTPPPSPRYLFCSAGKHLAIVAHRAGPFLCPYPLPPPSPGPPRRPGPVYPRPDVPTPPPSPRRSTTGWAFFDTCKDGNRKPREHFGCVPGAQQRSPCPKSRNRAHGTGTELVPARRKTRSAILPITMLRTLRERTLRSLSEAKQDHSLRTPYDYSI